MATKKATPKSSAVKAAPKKAAPKKAEKPAADKATAPKIAAAPKAPKKAAAPKAAGVKKAPKKSAPAVKLTDAQTTLLKDIAGAGEAGVVATKKTQKSLDSLQAKKLIKKGKKEGEFFKYHVSKVGEKHVAGLSAAPGA